MKQIGNMLAETVAHTRSKLHRKIQGKRNTMERNPIHFESTNYEIYNKNLSIRELLDSLKKANDTAVGPDGIHYQISKQFMKKALEVLLDIYYEIWSGGDFPSQSQKQEKISQIQVITVQ